MRPRYASRVPLEELAAPSFVGLRIRRARGYWRESLTEPPCPPALPCRLLEGFGRPLEQWQLKAPIQAAQ